jgi:threonyl-tRNA synthetase
VHKTLEEVFTMEKEEVLKVYRHSLAHIMAKAVIEIFGKEVQYAIGPEIEDGCYYDFILPRAVTEEDFPAIEEKMHEIIKRREDWTRKELSRAEALEIFKDQKFKTELINDLPEGEVISTYNTGDDFIDLCRGPHVDNSQELFSAAFKIKNVSGAYWRGDEKRDQLQRIYLFAFPSKDELKAHLAWLKEAQERDHKKIGTQLDLFMFRETAPGMAYWLPRGWVLYQELMKYSREIQLKHGYTEISAPLSIMLTQSVYPTNSSSISPYWNQIVPVFSGLKAIIAASCIVQPAKYSHRKPSASPAVPSSIRVPSFRISLCPSIRSFLLVQFVVDLPQVVKRLHKQLHVAQCWLDVQILKPFKALLEFFFHTITTREHDTFLRLLLLFSNR